MVAWSGGGEGERERELNAISTIKINQLGRTIRTIDYRYYKVKYFKYYIKVLGFKYIVYIISDYMIYNMF